MTVLAVPRRVQPPPRALTRHPAALLGLVGAVVGFVGSWIPSYWGDEAASVLSATRSLPSLLTELTTIDGVHGVYYAILHVWVSVFGTSELATRLPSAIAVGFMVSGTVVLVRPFAGSRTALIAGAVLIVLPRTTWMATEARSYALGAAAAVWVTILLVNLLRRRPPSAAGWVSYGVAMAASIYLFLFLALLLLVHAALVIIVHRSQFRGWMRGAGVAVLLSAPIAALGYREREQIDFLARRDYATAANVFIHQWFGGELVAVLCWGLILGSAVAFVRATRLSRRRGSPIVVLGFLWLIVPTAVLLVGSELVSPAYNVRYLSFCTPAAAILIAVGITELDRTFARRVATATAAGMVILLAVLCAPGYIVQRSPYAKDGGSDLRQVAEFIGTQARAGDSIVFDRSTKPSRDPRLAVRLYPSSFSAVHDIGLVTDFYDTSGLWDTTTQLSSINLASVSTVWAVELSSGSAIPADVITLQSRGFRVDSSTVIHRSTIYRLTSARP